MEATRSKDTRSIFPRVTGVQGWARNGRWMLPIVLILEMAVFSAIAPHFFTIANFFEVARFSIELGLLATALTPVLITGGIDLSVASMMGLAAVLFGAAYSEWRFPLVAAVAIALLSGCAGGALNALLIAQLNLPPLIVTLGSLSLFRGIAEGLTHGAVNYSGFPGGFLFLGQGYLWSVVPAQLPLFVLVYAAYNILLHRSVFGRAFYAIGFTAAGARYAGIPVAKRLGLVYVLSGMVSSLAAIIYVAHLGQAKADAGTGYELDAITAVVLGGTSVFGGRGTLGGTLLGLLSLSILQNGLHLAALPSELTGVLTGVLLVATIAVDRLRRDPYARSALTDQQSAVGGQPSIISSQPSAIDNEDTPVKNSQVAVLCGTILLGSIIVAGTNVWLVHSLGSTADRSLSGAGPPPRHRPVIAVMPKAKGDPYFVSCRAGAEEAARDLNVDLIWDGPTSLDAAKQNELIENWITRRVDVIAVAVENRAGISTVLRKARARAIHVLTWDADAEPDAREFFVNQATPEGIANTLTDEAARLLQNSGEFAVITGALTAANQNEWIKFIKQRLADRYPRLKLVTIRPSDDDRDKAFAEAQTILKVYPGVKLIMAIAAPAVPGAAEAVRQSGLRVDVIGLSLPNINKPYVHGGIVQTIVLWNTRDLGYLTVYAGAKLAQNEISTGAARIEAGRLGPLEIHNSEIVLGVPLRITKSNIDGFDF